ncbi:MAG: elongation factor P [Candidatus Dojkabacteria bacterium]|nr:elongation factor P [Candidatus Dojkabacteria bacterium]
MATLSSNEIKKEKIIIYRDQPHIVISHEMKKFGRGGASNSTKLKNLITGSNISVTFSGSEKADEADVVSNNIQFLYSDETKAYFMDPISFEQVEVEIENIPGERSFLKEEELYLGMFFNDKIISITLPKKMSLEVTSASSRVKGDTANNPQKEVTVETGFVVKVPMFIKQGDIIQINTDEGSYTGKDN